MGLDETLSTSPEDEQQCGGVCVCVCASQLNEVLEIQHGSVAKKVAEAILK